LPTRASCFCAISEKAKTVCHEVGGGSGSGVSFVYAAHLLPFSSWPYGPTMVATL
jgi:hypothetical protein